MEIERGMSISVPKPTVINVSESVASEDKPVISRDPDDIENVQPGECGVDNLTFDNREDSR